jgi:pimeloyl-ACP methyl ester carboxylesterase
MTARHETLPVKEIDLLLAGFLHANARLPAQYDIDTYRIWFRTRDEDDLVISIQAEVRFPRVAAPQTFPVLVYGAGTTGIANKCAALNERYAGRQWGNYRAHMVSYAAQGYIAVLPNWQGYDDPERTHPYFVSELEGRVMLDAARAAYDFFEQPPTADINARPDAAVFLGGYSQGGHGAFSAGRMAPSYAPGLEIKGLIGHAMSPDVEGLMYDSPRYSPYIVYAYRDFYGDEVINPVDVFQPHWLEAFEEDVKAKCIDEALTYYSDDPARMYTNRFRDALYNDRLAEEFPLFKEELDANDSSQKAYTTVPALFLHGAADPIVKVGTIEQFVSYVCQQGVNVTYNLYPGINHFQIRQGSFDDTLRWMEYILDGNTPVSNCTNVARQ